MEKKVCILFIIILVQPKRFNYNLHVFDFAYLNHKFNLYGEIFAHAFKIGIFCPA